jgi:hypothetical protein
VSLPAARRCNVVKTMWKNSYFCDPLEGGCGNRWTDVWSCQVDDDCPKCGKRHWTPYKSVEV